MTQTYRNAAGIGNRSLGWPFAVKARQLHGLVCGAASCLIVAHDYPDPDCLGAAFGLQRLLRYWRIPRVSITFGGFIGRAENRALISLLNIKTIPFARVDPRRYDRIILVDCFPGNGNVSLPCDVRVDAVIDHHRRRTAHSAIPFSDIRPGIAATSTIITGYLLACGAPIDRTLATALYYGIRTDSGQMTRHVSDHDLACYAFLFNRVSHHTLGAIENPDLDGDYFRTIHDSIENMRSWGPAGFIRVSRTGTPDHIAEIADYLFRLRDLQWLICCGKVNDSLFFSVRSRTSARAGRYAERISREFGGNGGGHAKVAAGTIPLHGRPAKTVTDAFFKSFRRLLRIKTRRPSRLI